MIYLLLSIVFNASLAVIFRLYKKYDINNFPAIVVNYLVCVLTGMVVSGSYPVALISTANPWLPFALVIGLFFIAGFNITALAVQSYGLSVTSIFQKTSLIVTVLFALLYFRESLSVVQFWGIVLALAAILLSQLPIRKSRQARTSWRVLLPLGVFIVNGVIETMLYYLQRVELIEGGDFNFVTVIFSIAAAIGVVLLVFQRIAGTLTMNIRDVVGGIVLGIPNYFSIHFLIHALDSGWDGSIIIPANNVGIIALSVLAGLLLFHEKLTLLNRVGVVLAILAILMLTVL